MGAFLFWTAIPTAEAGWGNLFEGVKGLISGGSLENKDIVAGLKEALRIGADNSVTQVGQIDGYLKNPDIHIGLPGPVAKAEKLLRFAGYGDQIDAFETSMNRAAEQAAPQAKEIFWQAIGDMTLDDARQILDGGDTAATDYFADRTRPRLAEIFSPIVHNSLASVGATKNFQDLDTTLKSLPLGESLSFDLDRYVTDGALDGLFLILGEEERKIRENPGARTTHLLKKVFGAAK
ncbi:hypothetical protein A7E78_00930 [Syntrophotalea acetylenivorans]|uniref:DUF4197 domain-containing protein n=2 Tax=Syntrophotalea acetylenivorans TaxID=1842532 RepID=A0A1L3GSU2_9BACT|nr:hypothetical protein A7E78_00930 [Syntrophotalea acetylenivorans]